MSHRIGERPWRSSGQPTPGVVYYLAGSKCKPNTRKKVYYFNRPKDFFLYVNSRITSNIFKTCFGQSEQVWMDEKLITTLLFQIQSSAFVFFKSLNLSPLNSKSLENS